MGCFRSPAGTSKMDFLFLIFPSYFASINNSAAHLNAFKAKLKFARIFP